MFITAVFTMPKFESKQEAIQQVKGKTNCGARVLSCFSRARLFATLWTVAHQAPRPWDSPRKNSGAGCHTLLQGIFLTQGSNPCLLRLLHCRRFFTTEPPGKPLGDTRL